MPEQIMEYLPFLIPLVVLELALAIAALVHIFKHPCYKLGNKPLWVVVVIFIGIIGPVLYFAVGRGEEA